MGYPAEPRMSTNSTVFHVKTKDELRGHYLDFLVFGQSVYNCDDKVFGKSEVCGTNTLRAVHNECQVQRCTLTLLRYTKHTHKQNHKGS